MLRTEPVVSAQVPPSLSIWPNWPVFLVRSTLTHLQRVRTRTFEFDSLPRSKPHPHNFVLVWHASELTYSIAQLAPTYQRRVRAVELTIQQSFHMPGGE